MTLKSRLANLEKSAERAGAGKCSLCYSEDGVSTWRSVLGHSDADGTRHAEVDNDPRWPSWHDERGRCLRCGAIARKWIIIEAPSEVEATR